jgi:two-component system sensor histidine kinase SenX3
VTASVVLTIVLTALAAVMLLVGAFTLGVRSAADPRGIRGPRARDADLLQEALRRLGTPVLVVTGDGRVVHASEEALRLGLVRAGYLAHGELRALCRDASREPGTGAGHDSSAAAQRDAGVTVVLPRGPVGDSHLEIRARTHRLGEGYLLLDVENRSEAMRVEDVRRDFVVNVSHELKTPVGAISVLAETLEQAADDPAAVRRFVSRIRQECARLAVLVSDVLELSRVQVVDGTPRNEPVGLDDVVTEALQEVQARAEEQQITLTRTPPPGAVVLGDRELLTTAVRNLLVNAVAYSPPRTRVSVSVGRRDGLVLVQVTDRGIGIPVGEHERVFERFYRVDPARSRRTGGTGLGLAIVKHVAENHGGDVQVWSRPGQGSTFTIRLPEADTTLPTGGPQ